VAPADTTSVSATANAVVAEFSKDKSGSENEEEECEELHSDHTMMRAKYLWHVFPGDEDLVGLSTEKRL
jgi:hypothetical protein